MNLSSQVPQTRRTIKPQTLLQWIAAGDKFVKLKQPAKGVPCFIKVSLVTSAASLTGYRR